MVRNFIQHTSSTDAPEAARALRQGSEKLPRLSDTSGFGSLFDRYADAHLVLLGEATHGTSEFYQARAAITQRLIQEHGFTIVAVEADWPDAARIDHYVRHRSPEPVREQAFDRFPTWMWRNQEVLAFIDWLRGFNEQRPADTRVEFRGLDVYSLRSSIAAVLEYLGRVDPQAAQIARRRYACLTPWHMEPVDYGRAVLWGDKEPCEDAVVAELRELLGNRLAYAAQDGEAFFDAAQNARVVHAAERYYRTMYLGSRESWNLRDRHMFDTLQGLLERRPGSRAVVWAHNSHIGNAAATSMGWEGEFNIGELCRKAFRENAVLIGFGTDRGAVAAASAWDEPMEIKTVRPARPDSYEFLFREAGLGQSLTDWRGRNRPVRDALSASRLERAIGVIYRPETERQSHYFEAVMPDQFDAFIWFEETHAITPLPGGRPQGMPDTHPFGL
ncbi:MAG: erythromycin esterase family protein [Acetobacteraceae bacterium]|nr:erythromycin esterase family protein [Acetobacteraceae bacterium]MBV8525911.1 erythromycin esterase family protein [Acetobacteraceae bacterium]